MMRRLIRSGSVVGVVGVLMLVGATTARAQTSPAPVTDASGEGFTVGYMDVGPVIGLGGIGGAGVSVGGRLEYGFKQLPNLANGVLSIEVGVDHYSYDNFGFGYSFTPVGVTVNYHYPLQNRKLDPFFGVGVGAYNSSFDFGGDCLGCGFNSGIYIIGRGGIRYFWTPKLALYGDVGAGSGSLHVGLMLKLKGGQ